MEANASNPFSRWIAGLLFAALTLGTPLSPAVNGQQASRASGGEVPSGVQLLSKNFSQTAAGNSASTTYAVSADERYVAFVSNASDLVPNDLNGTYGDIFRMDRETGQIDLVSMNLAGTGSANYLSNYPAISADGRFVAFASAANDLVSNVAVPNAVFIRDMQAGVTQAISVDPQGTLRSADHVVAMSGDGRYVVFLAWGPGMLPSSPTSYTSNIYVRDTWLGETKMVSINRFGTSGGNGNSGYSPSSAVPAVQISSDGRFVAFISSANDLVKGDWYPGDRLFVRDLVTQTTKMITGAYLGGQLGLPAGVVISRNNRYIAYSAIPGYGSQPSNCYQSVLVYDLQTATNTMVSRSSSGAECSDNESSEPTISADGRYVAFTSLASNLIPDTDRNNNFDIYVRDLQLGITTLVSINRWNNNGGNGKSYDPSISADGRFVSFTTLATNLTPLLDKNQQQDIVLRDLLSGVTKLVSAAGPRSAGNASSLYSWVSSDGSFVVFNSDSSDLAGADENRAFDVYIYGNGPAVMDKPGGAIEASRGSTK
jgi:Tol biopolymer transport system component